MVRDYSVANVFLLAASPTSPADVFVGSAVAPAGLVGAKDFLNAATMSAKSFGTSAFGFWRIPESRLPWRERMCSSNSVSKRRTSPTGMSSR